MVRGGPVRRGSRAGVPCPETAGRRSTRPPVPRSQNPILLPPLPRWEEEEEKKRRSLAHRNVGRAGSRGPHHTTPRRLDRHSGVLPPRYPLSLSVLYSPLPCPGFDLPRCLVLRFLRSRVFWLLRCWAPSRLPNTQKKFEQTMTTTLLRPQPKISKIEKTKFPNGNIGIFFFVAEGESERDRRRCAPRAKEGDDSQDGNSGG